MEKKRKGPKRIRSVRGAEVIAMRKWDKWNWPLFIGLAIFSFWGLILMKHHFIPNYLIIIFTTIAGGLLMLFIFRRQGDFSNADWNKIQWMYFLFGASVGYFSIPAINYYGPRKPAITVLLPIQNVTKPSRGSGSHVHVSYNNDVESIYFDSDFKDTIYKAKMVELTLEKGILGYYIYSNEKLIP